MAKSRIEHICTDCGASHSKWAGQCSSCGQWNTLVEEVAVASVPTIPAAGPASRIGDVDPLTSRPRATSIGELDRVLGGGLVAGSVTLLGGEPGIGKSTLLLQLLAAFGGTALYVTAEESAQQVRLRAERLGAGPPRSLAPRRDGAPHILASIDDTKPDIVVVDSVQTIHDPALGSPPGSVVQVRGCAQQLVNTAKQRGVPIVLVGHVTRRGRSQARVLEHVVDTVLAFEGERHHALRLLRATKHRFGPDERARPVRDGRSRAAGRPRPERVVPRRPAHRHPGSAVAPTIDGQRPLLVEVQALTTPAPPNVPARRTTQGIDSNRLALLLAVLQQRKRASPPGRPTCTHPPSAAYAWPSRGSTWRHAWRSSAP
ncbi:MAG: ATPase domain-containing protein [Ilumatobacteraceae bacterium]